METAKIDSKRMLILSAFVVVVMFAISAWAWGQIPEGKVVPVHWGINGEVDRYGSKMEGLLVAPFIVLAIVVLFAFLPKMEPKRLNFALSQKPYHVIWGGLLLFFLALHLMMIWATLGNAVNIALFMSLMIGALFIVMGNYMGKIRQNYFMGIRTPWTLASELSWNKTHRLGGKLFVAIGLAQIVSAFFSNPFITFGTLMGGIVILLVATTVYSYQVWKSDPKLKHEAS